MKTVAIYNLKGGVGKTATAVNLSYLAAKEGLKTLLLDLDPQGSSSFYFRIRPSKKFNAEKFAKGKKLYKHIKETDFENLDLLPADMSFRTLDIIFEEEKKPEKRLKKVLANIKDDYDIVIIDSPASIGVDSENIFCAADRVIVPLIPTTLSLQSLHKLLDFYYKNKLDLSSLIAFFSMVDKRKKMHREIMDEHIGKESRFLKSTIPYSSEVEQMGVYRQPLVHKHPRVRSALAFHELWKEIQTRIFIKQDAIFFTEKDEALVNKIQKTEAVAEPEKKLAKEDPRYKREAIGIAPFTSANSNKKSIRINQGNIY